MDEKTNIELINQVKAIKKMAVAIWESDEAPDPLHTFTAVLLNSIISVSNDALNNLGCEDTD